MNSFFRQLIKILIAISTASLLFFWVYLQLTPVKTSSLNYFFNIGVGAVYLAVGAIALVCTLNNIERTMKSFLYIFGGGLIAWATASFIWGYYNIALHSEVPYPSLADYFFISYSLLMGMSFWYYFDIFKARITRSSLRDSMFIVVGIYLLIFFVLYRPTYNMNDPFIETVFNYLYPLLDSMILSLAVVAMRVEDQKHFSNTVPLVIAVLAQVVGDILFSYRTVNQTYWNGDVSDLFYLISGAFYFIAILKINRDFIHLMKTKHK